MAISVYLLLFSNPNGEQDKNPELKENWFTEIQYPHYLVSILYGLLGY